MINEWEPEIFVDLGNFADNLAASGHEPGRVFEKNLKRELHLASARLEGLTRGIPERHFVIGNHETRLERFIAKRAPGLTDSSTSRTCWGCGSGPASRSTTRR